MNLWIYGAGKDRERKKVTSTHTTRYVTLLNVVLALALTVALAACGSDEPSGVTGPDRTASTPGSGDAPTATVAPRPTAAPLAASDSAKTDRVALVALYNATGGDNWADNDTWLSDAPLGEWKGVTTNVDGRVTPLGLSSNELSGKIPPELGSLSNLELLALSGNELSGGIPPELGSLSSLTELYLNSNKLSGEIPAELGGLSNLGGLWLDDNALSGCVPSILEGVLDLNNSDLGGLPFC